MNPRARLCLCMPLFVFAGAGGYGRAGAQDTDATTIDVLVLGSGPYPARLATTSSAATGLDGNVELLWSFFLVRGQGRRILIDTGFGDRKTARRFRVRDLKAPGQLVALAGISATDVTDIILTHAHFDHADGVVFFQRARIHVHVRAAQELRNRIGRRAYAALEQRMSTFTGEIAVGPLRVIPVEGHARGSSVIILQDGRDTIYFPGDECYRSADCLSGRPLPGTVTVNLSNNRAFVQSVAAKARAPGARVRVLAGHDPLTVGHCGAGARVCRIPL